MTFDLTPVTRIRLDAAPGDEATEYINQPLHSHRGGPGSPSKTGRDLGPELSARLLGDPCNQSRQRPLRTRPFCGICAVTFDLTPVTRIHLDAAPSDEATECINQCH